MKAIDLTKVLSKDLDTQWVALSHDRTKVIGSSEDLMKLKESIGSEKVIYMKAALSGKFCAFLDK